MTETGEGTRAANPLRPLLDVAEALVSSLILEEALANAAAAIGEAMSVSKVDIYTYDRARDVLVYEAKWDVDGLTPEKPAVIGRVIDLQARPSWRPILEGNVVEFHVTDPDLPPEELAIYQLNDQKTTLDAPLIAGGEVIGVLGVVQRDRLRRFAPLEIDLFSEFCRIAAIGISNARVFRGQQECARHLDALSAAGDAVTSTLDDDAQLEAICRIATETLDVAGACVCEGDGTGAVICRSRHHREKGVAPDCGDIDPATLTTRDRPRDPAGGEHAKAVIRRLDDTDLTTEQREAMIQAGVGMYLDVPLGRAGRGVGILRVCDPRAERRFADVDIRLVEALGTQASIVLSRGV